jgi:hypothetical protein
VALFDAEPLWARSVASDRVRATICIDANHEDDCTAVSAWFERWGEHLVYVSKNEGRGCCVDIWNVEGPTEAIFDLPPTVRAMSDWPNDV